MMKRIVSLFFVGFFSALPFLVSVYIFISIFRATHGGLLLHPSYWPNVALNCGAIVIVFCIIGWFVRSHLINVISFKIFGKKFSLLDMIRDMNFLDRKEGTAEIMPGIWEFFIVIKPMEEGGKRFFLVFQGVPLLTSFTVKRIAGEKVQFTGRTGKDYFLTLGSGGVL